MTGDLTDCPAALSSLLLLIVANFSMNTFGPLYNWMSLLEDGVDDIAVSKHITHAAAIKQVVDTVHQYVSQICSVYMAIYVDAVEERTNDSMAAALETPAVVAREKSLANAWQKFRTVRYLATECTARETVLPDGAEDLPISYHLIKSFLGKSPCTYLNSVIHGSDGLEMKGLRYWRDRVEDLETSICVIKEKIKYSLDEKRNFYNYVLAVVTVFLGPMTVLTGYWGMNFDNMKVIDGHDIRHIEFT